MSGKVRALVSDGPDTMRLADVDRPVLKPGQVRVKVRAFGVNRADLLQRRGLYPPPPGDSELLGLEAAGDVVECAPGVGEVAPGDRVMALLGGGGYCEEVCVDSGLLMGLTKTLSYAEGAAIPEAFITAHHNLRTLGRAGPGSLVLIHAGASGVGTAGIQLLRGVAEVVFATVGSAAKAAATERLGATAIRYKEQDFAAVIAERTLGRGVDVILDPVGSGYLAANLASLATGGRLVLIGLMSGKDGVLDLGVVLRKRLALLGSTLRSLPLPEKRAVVARFKDQCLPRFATGELRPVIDAALPAADVAAAHARMAANLNIGKLVLEWS